MTSTINRPSFIFSPLDQFDNVGWLSSRTIETSDLYSLFTFETERDAWTLFAPSFASSNSVLSAVATSRVSSSSVLFALPLIVALAWRLLPAGSVPVSPSAALSGFSHLFLLGALHLITGGFITIWFADLLLPTLEVGVDSIFSATSSDALSFSFAPQIDFSFYVDERRVSLFLAFFLLGAGEEEEDEDRLRSEEADLSRVEEIVAPIVLTNLGKEVAEIPALYLQVCGLFAFLLTSNLRGRVPYSDTATASLGLTFWVSFAAFASLVTLRLRKHGLAYLARLFRPAGTPFPLLFLLVPIEFISYTFRLVSLAVRLFANRFAGHTLRKVLVGFAYIFLTLGDLYAVASVVPALVVFILVFLERAVAVIQAYIFTTLLALYRKDIFVGH